MINHVALTDACGTLILAENGNDMVLKCNTKQWEEGVAKYEAGALMQEAFPFLNADEREFLISGLTPEEFEKATNLTY